MWRFGGVIIVLFAMVIAYFTIPHYITGSSQFEVIVTDFRTYLLGFVIFGIMTVFLVRE